VTIGAAQPITSTTLKLTAAGAPVQSVASGTVVTATASVSAGSTSLTTGQVNFCDATATYCDQIHLLGSAQLTSAGTAVLPFIPGIGSHSYKAVFAGTNGEAVSSSSVSSLTVTASQASTTNIAQSGNPGSYTLTATVTGQGLVAPGGNVSFLDTSSGNALLGSASLGHGTATLTSVKTQSPATGAGPRALAVGDFNGDGIPDLAVANSSANTLTILQGNRDGTFTANSSAPQTGSQPYFVAVGDFNKDGKADLAVANRTSNSVTVLLGNGDGTFTASASTQQTGYGPTSIAVGDFNGDGLQDLAVVNGGSNTVTILLGNGDGTFTAAVLSPQIGSYPQSIAVGDFNGDGKPDLAVANEDSNTVTVLLGNGDGSFVSVASPSTGSYPESIAVGDFNGDGKPDLAVANTFSNTVTVLLGNGDGTFTAAASPSTGNSPESVAVGDFNGDGKSDLAVANTFSNTVTVLLGNGDGTFTAAASPSTGTNTNPTFVAAGDFNADGIPDIVVTNTVNSTVTVLASQLMQRATATASSISPVGHGQHAVDASYAGDSSYVSSVSGTTQLTAEPAAPVMTLNLSSSSITTTQALTVTVSVSGGNGNPTPTGSVTLTSGSYSNQQTLANGVATFSVAPGTLSVGSDTLNATYTPDASATGIYITATQSAHVTVSTAIGTTTPTMTVTASSVTITNLQTDVITVSVSGVSSQATPTGTVSLMSGAYSAQQTLSSGTASFTIAAGTLSGGANKLTAAYSGDATYAAGNGTVTVNVSPVVISVPTLSPVSPGANANGNVTLTSGSTYSGTMNLTCSLTASPSGAQSLPVCSLNPTSVTLTTGGIGTTVFTVKTTAASVASFVPPSELRQWGIGYRGSVLAVVLMFGIPSRRRRNAWILVFLLAAAVSGAVGCGGGGGNQNTTSGTPRTTAGSYTFVVTATDANSTVTTSANVVISVQ